MAPVCVVIELNLDPRPFAYDRNAKDGAPGGIYAPKGHSAFKITFTADAFELQAVAPLGSLTVLPPKP